MGIQDSFTTKSGEIVEVELTGDSLLCRSEAFTDHVRVPLDLLLAVDVASQDDMAVVTVHFARRADGKKLRVDNITLSGPVLASTVLAASLQKVLDAMERPKHLLVMVNPNSGKKRALKIFNRRVQPFFQLCKITSEVIVTTGSKQAKEIFLTKDLTPYDGVVSVGGDGLYCECLTGLTMRAQKDVGIDYNRADVDHVPSPIPIGIIPAGSGDYAVHYLHGTRDVMTAAIHIVLGQQVAANAVSLHIGGETVMYSALIFGFGLIGDMVNDCEKFRWMGPSRYHVIPMGTVLRRRMIDMEVEFQSAADNRWRKSEGRMYGVDSYVITRKETGDSLTPCFADDALSIHLTRKCSFRQHVQHLTKVENYTSGAYNYDFVQIERVNAFRVRMPKCPVTTTSSGKQLLQEKLYINCDGEVVPLVEPEFACRLHRRAVSLFGHRQD